MKVTLLVDNKVAAEFVGVTVKGLEDARAALEANIYNPEEYPKWVKNADGDDVLVASAKEEAALKAPTEGGK